MTVVILGMIGVYLALAVLFYLGLAAAAADNSVPTPIHRSRWQRARHVKEQALRRLLALRLPKRPH